MAKLNFGIGGVALSSASSKTEDGIRRVKELGLDLMELEFVHGVRMSPETALKIRELKEKEQIELTVHGPYYINLASLDNHKFYGSIKYITDSLYIGGLAGAKSVTFHSAFYQGMSAEETYALVKKAITKIYEEFSKPKYEGHPFTKGEIVIAPELTGKAAQFGDLEELIQLCRDFSELNLRFCFDFAHKFARSNGRFNSYEEFTAMLDQIERGLGKEFLDSMHMHVSGIMHSDKGERNHLTFLGSFEEYQEQGVAIDGLDEYMEKLKLKKKIGPSLFNWQELLRALKDKQVGGYLVCESPVLEMDALLLQKYYRAL